ncbi:hypothetical protein EMIT0196MI5_230050 [Pseudomonas sp. IT-196MI5]|uniref:DUF3604 domain-containing protein n=1 Tax=unclassified Pseudomonas TaxID=196821 RepID=UPI0039DFD00E
MGLDGRSTQKGNEVLAGVWAEENTRELIFDAMGGDLPAKQGKQSLSFVVWAVKDVDDGNLDRIQIIKGWSKNGQTFEIVYGTEGQGLVILP